MRLFALSSLLILPLIFSDGVHADTSASALYPPSLLPLINRANSLLSSGQFNDAARAYSEAIEQSPSDYLLYYKRATAYFSLNRHPNALDDFEKVLALTSSTFDNAFLMKAKIYAKDGRWAEARDALTHYTKKVTADQVAADLMASISEAQAAAEKAQRAKRAQLWTACTDFASSALRTAGHSIEVRQLRAECALAAGDIEGAVGDLSRLTQLSPPSTTAFMRIFRLAYFFLPPSTPSSSSPAMTALKHCLHFDPDSKPCLSAHRLIKSFEKSIVSLDTAMEREDWRAVITLIMGKDKSKPLGNGFLAKFEEALEAYTAPALLHSSPTTSDRIPMPSAQKKSPRRAELLRVICRAFTYIENPRAGERWCDALLAMDGFADDVDGLVGKGEAALKKEQWEEAVKFLESAWESSERSNRRILQRLQKAQRLLKQSTQKDYYKVLGVARDADAKTIKKAFRRAAMKAHPDKGGTEAKMAAVNEAYEVLSKPELRAQFDAGEDPNDPMAQQQGHPFTGGFGSSGHPFAQFFEQQGGGGFQFHHSHHH